MRRTIKRDTYDPLGYSHRRSASPAPSRASALLVALLVALSGTGCGLKEWRDNGFKVGPNYTPPPADVASTWVDYQDPRVKSEEVYLGQWWTVFGDPTLNSLVDDARKQNLNLRVAGARIAESRARRGIAVGNLFPQQQEAVGGYTRNGVSKNTAFPTPERWFDDWNAGFNLSWELDFWGRLRRSIESADAELDASIDNYDDVMVMLLADVASTYVQYRVFEQRLTFARQNAEIQTKAYQLADDKFKAGAATERDVQQSKQVLEQTRATIPQFEAGMRQAANSLCVLLGVSPRDLAPRLGVGNIPVASAQVAVGIPADLLRRRPDVRRAERLTAAQSALIGVAKADLYPQFSINGSIGVSAENFNDLFNVSDSFDGFIGPSFRWNILNYGRIENNVHVQEARTAALFHTYQDAVLRAAREAEDSLIGFVKSQERAERLALSVTAAKRTVEITYDQYRDGAVDFTPVFLFEGTLTEQQDQLAQARGDIALNLVNTYRSLGGGWEPPPADGSLPPPPSSAPAGADPSSAPPSLTRPAGTPPGATQPAASPPPATRSAP